MCRRDNDRWTRFANPFIYGEREHMLPFFHSHHAPGAQPVRLARTWSLVLHQPNAWTSWSTPYPALIQVPIAMAVERQPTIAILNDSSGVSSCEYYSASICVHLRITL